MKILITTTIFSLAIATNAAEVSLNTSPMVDSIIFSGEITKGDSEKVSALIEKVANNGKIHQFTIHSPGGNITAAMDIGNLLRANVFIVFEPLGTSCISACIFTIAGGSQRIIAGQVGLHHPYLPQPHLSALEPLVQSEGKKAMVLYMKKMGVQGSLIDAMYSLSNANEVRYLTADEMKFYQLTTENERN